MAITDWIDAVVAVAGSVASHRGGTVKAFQMASKSEVPEALSVYPCAIVYPEQVRVNVSLGKEIYQGVILFYLFPDTKKTNLPEIMRYFTRVRTVFALEANWTLGGLVDHFQMLEDGIEFMLLEYGDEVKRHGLQVRWEVKASF